jgi:hypothetical protein
MCLLGDRFRVRRGDSGRLGDRIHEAHDELRKAGAQATELALMRPTQVGAEVTPGRAQSWLPSGLRPVGVLLRPHRAAAKSRQASGTPLR